MRNQEISALNSRLAARDEIIAELGEQIDRLEFELASREPTQSEKIAELEAEISALKTLHHWSEIETLKQRNHQLINKFQEQKRKDAETIKDLEAHNRSLRRQAEILAARLAESPDTDFPEPADQLNQLKGKRKKSRTDLGDVEAILEILLS